MALWVIKQGATKKVEVYYEKIMKLANYLQHKAYDSLLTIFFKVVLVPYLKVECHQQAISKQANTCCNYWKQINNFSQSFDTYSSISIDKYFQHSQISLVYNLT
jgi:hypothetical protein